VALTGPYRSGKSFLANLLMDKMSGFKTGATVNACTRGLWAWGRPLPIENGSNMIIIDSEGLGSVEKDRELNVDMKIFTLCVLMSSCVIYNT
jgi:predicted GTPase